MAAFVVRNEADALHALAMIGESTADLPAIRFEGWPCLRVHVTSGIDMVRGARAIGVVQDAVERQFCALKYGSTDRRRLTDRDRVESKIDVKLDASGTALFFDFSGAATAAARAVRNRTEWSNKQSPGAEHSQTGGRKGAEGGKQESWERTAREVGLAVVRHRPYVGGALALAAVIVAGIAWAHTTNWKSSLDHTLDVARETNSHQLKLTELNRTRFVALNTQPVNEGAQVLLEKELEHDERRLRLLTSFEAADPVYRFVTRSVDGARPALLDLAPLTGSIDFNGLTIDASTARAAAKAGRRTAQAERPNQTNDGWTATVTREPRSIRS